MHRSPPDYILMIITAILILVGLLMLFSASSIEGQNRYGDIYYYFMHQILYGLLPGLILMLALVYISPEFLKKFSFPLLVINIIALMLVFVPHIGARYGGAARWLQFGTFTFQPGLLLGITIPLYISALLSKFSSKDKGNHLAKFIMMVVTLGIIGLLLIKQPATSILFVMGGGALVMYIYSGAKWQHTLIMIIGALVVVGGAVAITPYRFQRVKTFLTKGEDKLGAGYQANQAMLAIGAGGITGVGLGKGQSKLGFLPEEIGDSIVGVIGEETGFLGMSFLVILYLVLFWRIIAIANFLQKNQFMCLAIIGIGTMLAVQTFINLGANIGLIPVSGLPLPFISYGGTALTINLMQIGIILNFSRFRS